MSEPAASEREFRLADPQPSLPPAEKTKPTGGGDIPPPSLATAPAPSADLYITLRLHTPGAEWPRCYYDPSKLCGDRLLDNRPGSLGEYEPANKAWHIAGFCECPSCPIRCAIRDVMPK